MEIAIPYPIPSLNFAFSIIAEKSIGRSSRISLGKIKSAIKPTVLIKT